MASYRKGKWLARRKREGLEYCLGTYATKEEAETEEIHFDIFWPPPPCRYTSEKWFKIGETVGMSFQ